MRSVVHVTMGNPQIDTGGVLLPVGLLVSDDDRDDADDPEVSYVWFKYFVSHTSISKGNEFVRANCHKMLEETRLTYTGSGYHKITTALDAFIDSTDLAIYNVGWFEEPTSVTVH